MGRESLLVYATHLLLIYGDFGAFNFRTWAGQSFGYAESAMWTLLLLVLMLVLAYGWDRVRRADPRVKRWIQLAVLAVFVGVFLFGPGQ
jgi:MFS superfamily sulfate permease-like transporter